MKTQNKKCNHALIRSMSDRFSVDTWKGTASFFGAFYIRKPKNLHVRDSGMEETLRIDFSGIGTHTARGIVENVRNTIAKSPSFVIPYMDSEIKISYMKYNPEDEVAKQMLVTELDIVLNLMVEKFTIYNIRVQEIQRRNAEKYGNDYDLEDVWEVDDEEDDFQPQLPKKPEKKKCYDINIQVTER